MNADVKQVSLRPFDPATDRQRLELWLRRPHVARWWGDGRTALNEAMQRDPAFQAVIMAEDIPVGFLCWQRPSPGELREAGLTDLPDGVMDIDILIGEQEWVGRGIGPRALQVLADRLRGDPQLVYAGLATSVSNGRAIRAYEKAGFELFREFDDPQSGPCRYILMPLRESEC